MELWREIPRAAELSPRQRLTVTRQRKSLAPRPGGGGEPGAGSGNRRGGEPRYADPPPGEQLPENRPHGRTWTRTKRTRSAERRSVPALQVSAGARASVGISGDTRADGPCDRPKRSGAEAAPADFAVERLRSPRCDTAHAERPGASSATADAASVAYASVTTAMSAASSCSVGAPRSTSIRTCTASVAPSRGPPARSQRDVPVLLGRQARTCRAGRAAPSRSTPASGSGRVRPARHARGAGTGTPRCVYSFGTRSHRGDVLAGLLCPLDLAR